MAIYRDEGIIIKQKNLGEADRIATILTKRHGKVAAVAKGVRKLTSRKVGNVDMFVRSRFAFAEGKNLDVLTEAELVDPYQDLKSDLKDTRVLFYLAEILDKLLEDRGNVPKVYELLFSFLEVFRRNRNEILLRGFEIKLLNLLGYKPELKVNSSISQIFDSLLDKKFVEIAKIKVKKENREKLAKLTRKWLENIIEREIKTLSVLSN